MLSIAEKQVREGGGAQTENILSGLHICNLFCSNAGLSDKFTALYYNLVLFKRV